MKLICTLLIASVTLAVDIPLVAPIIFTPTIKVIWSKNTEPDIDYYIVTYRAKYGSVTSIQLVEDTTAILDMSSTVGKYVDRLYVTVQAVDTDGDVSAPSDTATIQVSKEQYLFGDVNHDGVINGIDVYFFWTAFGYSVGDYQFNPLFDFNVDGKIYSTDHVGVLVNYGQRMP